MKPSKKRPNNDDSSDDEDTKSYVEIKRVKRSTRELHYIVTNIISTNRNKLRELFIGEKFYEFLPYNALLSNTQVDEIRCKYTEVLDLYEKVKDKETFIDFDDAYCECVELIVRSFPEGKERDALEVTEVSIPMPYGMFYTAVTQLKEAFNLGKIPYTEYAGMRDFALRSRDNAYAMTDSFMQCMLYDDVISPSDAKYNELDTKYLDVIPTFCQVYGWLTDKVVCKHVAGLNLNVDRFKMHVRMGEMLTSDKYDLESMIEC